MARWDPLVTLHSAIMLPGYNWSILKSWWQTYTFYITKLSEFSTLESKKQPHSIVVTEIRLTTKACLTLPITPAKNSEITLLKYNIYRCTHYCNHKWLEVIVCAKIARSSQLNLSTWMPNSVSVIRQSASRLEFSKIKYPLFRILWSANFQKFSESYLAYEILIVVSISSSHSLFSPSDPSDIDDTFHSMLDEELRYKLTTEYSLAKFKTLN